MSMTSLWALTHQFYLKHKVSQICVISLETKKTMDEATQAQIKA
jgi:hypothetical protein